jgi:hypothetical protein
MPQKRLSKDELIKMMAGSELASNYLKKYELILYYRRASTQKYKYLIILFLKFLIGKISFLNFRFCFSVMFNLPRVIKSDELTYWITSGSTEISKILANLIGEDSKNSPKLKKEILENLLKFILKKDGIFFTNVRGFEDFNAGDLKSKMPDRYADLIQHIGHLVNNTKVVNLKNHSEISNQIKQKKPNELPDNIVILATTSQILESKSDGLRVIKKKYDKEYPTNITTIKYFEKAQEEDFLTYGSCHKNLYLLLLEDL